MGLLRKVGVLGVATLVASAASIGLGEEANSAGCHVKWGSLEKTTDPTDYEPLVNIRTGRHDCFDRMVFDVRDANPGLIGYRIRYVSKIIQDGSGDIIPVEGGALLDVRLQGAPSYDPETGEATYDVVAGEKLPGVNLTGYRTFRDARFVGSFEGDTQVGLGVRARLPFRVFQLDGGRLVLDVAHRW